MATTPLQLARITTIPKPSKKDKERYLLSRRGWSAEMLAARDSVKEHVIKQSIDRYQLYRDSLAVDEQDLAISEMTARLMPKVEKVMTDAMKAEHMVNVGRGQQVIMRKMADHATRIKAIETVKAFIETGRPKGGGIQINTQVNNNKDGNTAPGATKGFDFEARLRDIRERKGLTDGSKVIEGEYETEEKDDLADELAEMGIELDEQDEEDDDSEDYEEESDE